MQIDLQHREIGADLSKLSRTCVNLRKIEGLYSKKIAIGYV
jgi:hypothetical protein